MHWLGYTIALIGIQAYGQVSKAPAKFEAGVINGLYRELKGGHAPQLDPVTPLSLGAAAVSRSGEDVIEYMQVDQAEKGETNDMEDGGAELSTYRERNGESDPGTPTEHSLFLTKP
eukprot:symbB.v1.2.017140.t1/scaffold1268.1/size213459/21